MTEYIVSNLLLVQSWGSNVIVTSVIMSFGLSFCEQDNYS